MPDRLVYDGDCGFCTVCAAWLSRRLADDVLIVPWQSVNLQAFNLTLEDVTTAVWWVGTGRKERGHRAVGRSLQRSVPGLRGLPWRLLGRILLLPGVGIIAGPMYAAVSRNRHRLPGATAACAIRPGRPSEP